MTKKQKCDHTVGFLSRIDDPLVKMFLLSELDSINERSEALSSNGFNVTIFPFCSVCGAKLLRGYFKKKPDPQQPNMLSNN